MSDNAMLSRFGLFAAFAVMGLAAIVGPSGASPAYPGKPAELPVITEGATIARTIDEDNPYAFDLTLHATDGDGDTLTWSIETQASHGTATASGTGTSKVISYAPAANANGSDSFVVMVSDGLDGSDSITVNVTVNPVNDAPVNTVPIGQTVSQDTNLVFSAAAGNAVTVADVDVDETTVPGNTLQTTLTVGHGQVTLHQTTGLTIIAGANGSASMTFTGSAGDVNAAMNGMVYRGAVDYSGSDSLTILSSDLGHTGAGGAMTDQDSIAVTVQDTTAPTVLNVTSNKPDGSYRAGVAIDVQVNFNEIVNVIGVPQITLETGTVDAVANYMTGSGSTVLTFLFAVAAGSETADLDYASAGSLALNGGTITDATDNVASLVLPDPGTPGLLGANKNIVIDTTVPAAPGAPDLEAASDTGSSNTDNITDVTTPSFAIAGVESLSTVRLISSRDGVIGTVTVGEGQSSCILTPTVGLTQGAHVMTATQTDQAGNVSVASPAMAPDLHIAVSPSVTTQAATDITSISATGHGDIVALGIPSPTAHGLVWNTTGSPTLSDSSTNEGGASSAGTFTGPLAGLNPGTTYHVRAYATNDLLTVYGDDVTFSTVVSYALTVNAANGAVTRAPDQASYDHGTSVVLTAAAAENYHFVDWTGDAAGSENPLTVTMDGPKTITANFVLDTFTISGTVTAGGTGVPDVTLAGFPDNPVTDASGHYAATVNHGFSGTVTPTHSDYAFDPASQVYTNVTADIPDQNYSASLMTTPQRQALAALYNSTNGDGWIDNSGWKTPPLYPDGFAMPGTEGTWFGVTVDSGTQAVTQIILSYNNLTGSLPVELGSLTGLIYLVLDHNSLGGSIPVVLGGLPSLQDLNLWSNQLIGSIPPELGNLSNLRTLLLHSNQLSGSIPPELGNLANLETLVLRYNLLTGGIPVELGKLTHLQVLRLGDNGLSGGIPVELGNLTDLQSLRLAYDHLSGGIPAELGNLTRLSELLLNSNQLTGPIPTSLANLTALGSSNTNIGYNALTASDEALITFLDSKDADWAATQTIAPTEVTAASLDNAVILVSWLPVAYTADAGYFRVLISDNPGGPYTLAGQTADKATTAVNVTALTPGQRYYFVVETVTDPHGDNLNIVESGASAEASAVAWLQTSVRIAGTVTVGGAPLAGVVMNGLPGNPLTGVDGVYSVTVAAGSTLTVTPTLEGYTFTPGSLTYTSVQADQADQDYAATPAVVPAITVTSPNGGERWAVGSSHDITWTQTGLTGSVTIDLYQGGVFQRNLGTADAAGGTLFWTIASDEAAGADFRILVWQSGGLSDESDADFSIVRSVRVDFNKDGQEDLLWRYYGLGGTNRVWFLGTSEDATQPLTLAGSQLRSASAPAQMPTAGASRSRLSDPRDIGVVQDPRANLKAENVQAMMRVRSGRRTATATVNDPRDAGRLGAPPMTPASPASVADPTQAKLILGAATSSGSRASTASAKTWLGGADLLAVDDLNWKIRGTGDFDGDGNVDILWRYEGPGGANVIWFMDGTDWIGSAEFDPG